MSQRKNRLRTEVPKFIKAYARKKNQIDPNDRDFDPKVLKAIERMDLEELSLYITGDDEETIRPRPERKGIEARRQWLKQRKRLQYAKITILGITAEGIEFTDGQGSRSFIDFDECRQNFADNRDVLASTYKISDWVEKCVGVREPRSGRQPPSYIEFFTNPPTRFEFSGGRNGRKEWEAFLQELLRVGARFG